MTNELSDNVGSDQGESQPNPQLAIAGQSNSLCIDSDGPLFPHSAKIIRRIELAIRNRLVDEASIAICQPGGRRCFSMDRFGAVAEVSGDDTLRDPTICMVKLYTATIAIENFGERNISLDQI